MLLFSQALSGSMKPNSMA